MLVSSISGVEPTTILRSAKLSVRFSASRIGAPSALGSIASASSTNRTRAVCRLQVPRSLAGDDLERAAGEQAMQDRRAILAVINLAGERTAQGRARLKHRLKVRNHVVAAVGLGRQQAQDRRRLVGDEVPERSGQKRGESDPSGLHQAHALDLGVPDAVGDGALIRPQPHRTRNCRRPLRQAHAGLDPGRSAEAARAVSGSPARGVGPQTAPSWPNSVSTARSSRSKAARSSRLSFASRDGTARTRHRTKVRIALHSRSTASVSTREPRRRAFLSAKLSACSFARRPLSTVVVVLTASPPPRWRNPSQ